MVKTVAFGYLKIRVFGRTYGQIYIPTRETAAAANEMCSIFMVLCTGFLYDWSTWSWMPMRDGWWSFIIRPWMWLGLSYKPNLVLVAIKYTHKHPPWTHRPLSSISLSVLQDSTHTYNFLTIVLANTYYSRWSRTWLTSKCWSWKSYGPTSVNCCFKDWIWRWLYFRPWWFGKV